MEESIKEPTEEPAKEPIVIDGNRMYLAGMMEEDPDLEGMTMEEADAFVERMEVARQEIRAGRPGPRTPGRTVTRRKPSALIPIPIGGHDAASEETQGPSV